MVRDMKYSIVIPVMNEEDSIKELIEKIMSAMKSLASPDEYEIIFIDDGSTDKTLRNIKRGKKIHGDLIKFLSFRKNFGKSAALSVGISHAKGDIVITMDGDLQDEPSEIPAMVGQLKKGFDVVSGWKENRQDKIGKTLPSKVFNSMIGYMTGLHLHDFNCGFKVYRKQAAKEIVIYGQLYRFIPYILYERGFKISERKVKHNKRKYGSSKYNWKRFFPGLMDLITIVFISKYAKRPLHFFGFAGALLILFGLGVLSYLTVLHFMGISVSERPILTIGSTSLLAGLQLLFTGLQY